MMCSLVVLQIKEKAKLGVNFMERETRLKWLDYICSLQVIRRSRKC